MNICIHGLVTVFFYCIPVSFSWSMPLSELTRLPSGDFWLGPEGTYPLHPENEDQRIITRTYINASVKGFSVALNSESAPLHMQFYDNVDTSELVIDLSDMAGLTPLTLQKTEFIDPQDDAPSEQVKISVQFAGLTHEFVILGESGALPDLKLTRHLSVQNSGFDIVIPVKQWFRPDHLQKRTSDIGSADGFDRAGMNESDSHQNDHGRQAVVGFAITFSTLLAIGEFLWVIGNIRLPKGTSELYESPLMAMRLFSYCIGLGIPLVQEFLIRTIYLRIKHEPLGLFWIPVCGK